ncbi:unnamed protein product [Phyllotreta striolata]|uniref:non-specific serine/threonine protein kinase n=1 Tax=Phyllotreta striolata TaxID=444603 RepID=A0A9N9TMS8_PHYSR|nr:unnamed protein product [Phyllotreta striolata]
MDPSLEIRKLMPSHVRELSMILETHDLWKRLMKIIPKTLDKGNFECETTGTYKYNSEHFRLIESESEKSRKTCTEILFDEWGTSGRIRPTLGHLLYLLTAARLFRAADYVAETLLRQQKPMRPETGPEAEIPVSLSEVMKRGRAQSDEEIQEIEKKLNDIGYVSNAVDLIRTHSGKTVKKVNKIPHIVITPDNENDAPRFDVPVVVEQKPNEEVSDMMKFSKSCIENSAVDSNVPNISLIIGTSGAHSKVEESSEIVSESTEMSESSYESSETNATSSGSDCNPAFSLIMSKKTTSTVSEQNFLPKFDVLQQDTEKIDQNQLVSEPNIPDFDVLKAASYQEQTTNTSSNETHPKDSTHLCAENSFESSSGRSDNLPDFSALRIDDSSRISPETSWSKTRSCSSPLPNLSLDTMLPHYNYLDIEKASNNFNTERYAGNDFEGRLLGKGEFGTVFLAFDLMKIPVAVKKLEIGDVEIVNVDDEVTKQFRNEVELLSKYRHENLLSILGYSCDGCTYCLLYEYAPGGALKDKLQDKTSPLTWKERFLIALGTSKAISYLHTAFSSPLIHRDIKSANILLDSQNQPKLGDFGLIKLIPNQNINTSTTVFGTSAYMPREAFAGDISVKLDTFSFGVVLLELLTSLPPLDCNREGADLVTHLGETIENDDVTEVVDFGAGSWTENDKNYSEMLYKLSQKCLEEKKKRPTMPEVTSELVDMIKNFHST